MEEHYKATPGKKGLSVPSFLCHFPLGPVEGGEGDPVASTSVVGTEQS